ncbi:dTDP-4-dehydrorhamnose 3,5-epimerase family protein [Roseovarius aestuariivivens]|uniref:polysaccharide biosynthesis C-terminal domain-containing protein n=1 Tax=Roseovarius aestuariivivens TaxID=1888910 RepID=UPI0010818E21|nr:dTDP-4-dehydrorhamnose 3,5-epimerase family protein [Roseovarius aestuariivivens]
MSTIRKDVFTKDPPWEPRETPAPIRLASDRIEGVVVQPLIANLDARGALSELLTVDTPGMAPLVHVYAVTAAPGSERGPVYHAKQTDRLYFIDGRFRILLIDLRAGSATCGGTLCFEAGANRPLRLHIPPYVAHGVKNVGEGPAIFVNMPTEIFDRDDPDKYRMPPDYDGEIIGFDAPTDF